MSGIYIIKWHGYMWWGILKSVPTYVCTFQCILWKLKQKNLILKQLYLNYTYVYNGHNYARRHWQKLYCFWTLPTIVNGYITICMKRNIIIAFTNDWFMAAYRLNPLIFKLIKCLIIEENDLHLLSPLYYIYIVTYINNMYKLLKLCISRHDDVWCVA